MGMLDTSIKAEVEKQLSAMKEQILEELKAMIVEQEQEQEGEQKPEQGGNDVKSELFESMQEQIDRFNADLDGLKKELMQAESLQEEERSLEESYLRVFEGGKE